MRSTLVHSASPHERIVISDIYTAITVSNGQFFNPRTLIFMRITHTIMHHFKYIFHEIQLIRFLLENACANTNSAPISSKAVLLNSKQVKDRLKISDSTYFRYVKLGTLNPMKLGRIDMYYEADIERALQESRRKGRI